MFANKAEASLWLQQVYPNPRYDAHPPSPPVRLREGIVLRAFHDPQYPHWAIEHETGAQLATGEYVRDASWERSLQELWDACVAWGPAKYDYWMSTSRPEAGAILLPNDAWELHSVTAGKDQTGYDCLFWVWKKPR